MQKKFSDDKMHEKNISENIKDIAKKLHPLERKILPFLKKSQFFKDIVKSSGMKEVEAMRALQWLENKGIIKIEKKQEWQANLDKNGVLYKSKGLPEKAFLEAIKSSELSVSMIEKKTGLDRNEINLCIGLLKKKSAINIRKQKELLASITKEGLSLLEKGLPEERFLKKDFPISLNGLSEPEKNAFESLLKRKSIIKKEKKTIRKIILTELGKKVSGLKLDADVIDRLDSSMLKSGSWKNKEFRKYDVEINVPRIYGGRRHFTNQVVEYIKSIWLELGFKEMTGNNVHTNFWDLDALFVPQDHPAREMQDTFYIEDPSKGKLPSPELVERVKNTHENGWTTGSLGWRSKWSSEKAKENLLRTHTTVLSAKTLAKLRLKDLPAKFFAVGKCFRNEALDWKHLFEFYQVEGIVVDPDANFSNLIGYLKEFFKKMGFPDVRIRPAHFPYTEPSAEVDVWHPVKKQWIEIAGSGIFRPETVKPLMGEAVPVCAWGIGLGRLITEYWDLVDLRDLYKNDLKQLREFKLWMK